MQLCQLVTAFANFDANSRTLVLKICNHQKKVSFSEMVVVSTLMAFVISTIRHILTFWPFSTDMIANDLMFFQVGKLAAGLT